MKKIAAILLTLTFVFALTSCGGFDPAAKSEGVMTYAEYVEAKGYEVLDYHIVQDVIISNFDKEVKPIFKKYGAEAYIPNIRTLLGFE